MNISQLLLVIAAFAALGLASCSHKVNYFHGPGDEAYLTSIPRSVKVEALNTEVPTSKKIGVRVGASSYRTNATEGYTEEETLGGGVSRMIAEHLEKSKLFEKVYYPHEDGSDSDLILSGTLQDYTAMGKVQKIPELASMISTSVLNVPGAVLAGIATAPLKTDMNSSVEFRDLMMKERATGKKVWWRSRLGRETATKAHWMHADAPGVYRWIDNELRLVINHMIDEFAQTPGIHHSQRFAPAPEIIEVGG